MDNLVKALRCSAIGGMYECKRNCEGCEYNQSEYHNLLEAIRLAADKIETLEKSNRNWKRNVQRLRKRLKEAKENGVS